MYKVMKKEGREERCEFEKERLSVKTSKAKFCPPATNTKRLQQMSYELLFTNVDK